MESKSQSVDIDTLKRDFDMLMEHLRIISCTGEYIINNKKKDLFKDKFNISKYMSNLTLSILLKLYNDLLSYL